MYNYEVNAEREDLEPGRRNKDKAEINKNNGRLMTWNDTLNEPFILSFFSVKRLCSFMAYIFKSPI